MKAFQYATAYSTESACQLVRDNGAYLAGGNDLLGLMKEYLASPGMLVNIKALPGLNKIEQHAKGWNIGALVTIAAIEHDPHITKALPGLREAALGIASAQIRNVATVGGNLAQHSRCWYFRHRDIRCLKKHGETCYARIGENRYHSTMGILVGTHDTSLQRNRSGRGTAGPCPTDEAHRPLPERRSCVSRYASARTLQKRSLRRFLQVESSHLLCHRPAKLLAYVQAVSRYLICQGPVCY
ncbi:MAG: FAD binding domain-containing protein [Limisphaerales bacterium]